MQKLEDQLINGTVQRVIEILLDTGDAKLTRDEARSVICSKYRLKSEDVKRILTLLKEQGIVKNDNKGIKIVSAERRIGFSSRRYLSYD